MRFSLQSSFELLITLSFGLIILLPIVVLAFIELANTNVALSSFEAQQAASNLADVATVVASEGPPASETISIYIPPGVSYIYVGNVGNTVGHEIIFMLRSNTGYTYITAYTPANISGDLLGATQVGTYLIKISALSSCPTQTSIPCVYITTVS